MTMTELAGKTVAVLGGGVEGASSARWLLRHDAQVTVRDAADPSTLVSAKALHRDGAEYVTGDDYLVGLERYDVIVRSPGIPFETHEVQAALAAGVTVTSQTKLFFERCPVSIIGITGTKGKGTTATLLRDMLLAAGETVHLGGNIGLPPLDFLSDIHDGDRVILELSSFQLQDLTASPHLAIVTNLGSDHLDHHADLDEYATAKENILRHQTAEDVAILNADDPGSRRLDRVGKGRRAYFGRQARRAPAATYDVPDGQVEVDVDGQRKQPVVSINDIPIPGPHNLQNVMAASLAARWLGATPEQIERAVIAFKALPYHLEPLGTVNGVTYVNDSYSTSPTATLPALESVKPPVILIAGGSDKGLDYTDLAKQLLTRTKAVIVIPPAGERIARAIQELGDGPQIVVVNAPEEVFQQLSGIVKPGDTVLLSPAAASFGWFDNYRERGAWFSREVAKLSE
jgi:UDP-N-acetylmuramoylalanine--D-glutamate ligase